MPLLGFVIYFFQKFDDFFASFLYLLSAPFVSRWAECVHVYALSFVVYYWVEAAAEGAVSVDFAALFLDVVEDAVAAVVAQFSVARAVKLHEERFTVAFSL